MKFSKTIYQLIGILALALQVLACSLSADLGNSSPASATPDAGSPAPSPSDEARPTDAAPSVETQTLEILAVESYLNQWGEFHVVGLVQNQSERGLDHIEIEIGIYDAVDRLLYTEVVQTNRITLLPGEISPFTALVWEDLINPTYARASVVGYSPGEAERPSIELRGHNLVLEQDGDIHLTGELFNPNPQAVQISSLSGAIFTPTGEFISAERSSAVTAYLNPGESGPYRITFFAPPTGFGATGAHQIYLDASLAAIRETYNLTLEASPYFYTDSAGGFHLVGAITNHDQQRLNINLVAGVYTADGRVLDAAVTGLPVYAIAPGETLGYDFSLWGLASSTSDFMEKADSYSIQWDPYWTTPTTAEYIDLEIAQPTPSVAADDGLFQGQVVNSSGQTLENLTVIVEIRDPQTGQLLAVDFASTFSEIAPDGVFDYQIDVDMAPDWDLTQLEIRIKPKGKLQK